MVNPATISIISPQAGIGRDLVSYGMASCLSSSQKVAIYRPIACRKETLTEGLLALTDGSIPRDHCVGTCPCKASNDPIQAREDALDTYAQLVSHIQPDIVLSVGSDETPFANPERLTLDLAIAADLKSLVFLEINACKQTNKHILQSIKNCTRLVTRTGLTVAGIFLTGCTTEQKTQLESTLQDLSYPCWLIDNFEYNIDHKVATNTAEAIAIFKNCVPEQELMLSIQKPKPVVTTPISFQHELLTKAKASNKTIVLPESEEDRILQAADYLIKQEIVKIILVGNRGTIERKAQNLNLKNISKASFISTDDEQILTTLTNKLLQVRAHKGISREEAKKQLTDPIYFATMLVVSGYADGLVAGSVNSTASTVRPALQLIKTKSDANIVSGAFLMCFQNHVALFADCAINPNPDAQQLADIAIQSAQTAQAFGIEPRIGMLSYSTLGSGKGPDVELVETATQLVQQKAPNLSIVGPIQFDAAWSPTVAATKAKGNPIAGHINVFVFPSLSAGNIAYKAVQRTAGTLTIGPILQGLKRPVNDLSRGALVQDIINTIALTAVQGENEESLNA